MKIHSPFKDFYDCGLRYYTDDEPVFIRNQVITYETYRGHVHKHGHKEILYGMIFFCGNYYPFIDFDGKFFFDFGKLQDVNGDGILEEVLDPNYSPRWSRKEDNEYYKMKSDLNTFKKDFPIASIHFKPNGNIERTTCTHLHPYNFQQVIPPMEAMRQLNTFLCNQARPEKKIIEVDDASLAASKGYDKWSFRNPQHKRKSKKS